LRAKSFGTASLAEGDSASNDNQRSRTRQRA
jgi:hypothetical protein